MRKELLEVVVQSTRRKAPRSPACKEAPTEHELVKAADRLFLELDQREGLEPLRRGAPGDRSC
jgi:hypothetical protein